MKYLLVMIMLSSALAQTEVMIPATQFATEEGQYVMPYQAGNVLFNAADPMALLTECLIGGTEVAGDARFSPVDTNADGIADSVRFYGTDIISMSIYAQAGPRALGIARTRARLKAEASVASTMDTMVAASAGLLDDSSMSLDSISLDAKTREEITSVSRAALKGARRSGTRIVNLPDNQGICVVERIDIPLAFNALPGIGGGYQAPEPGVYGTF